MQPNRTKMMSQSIYQSAFSNSQYYALWRVGSVDQTMRGRPYTCRIYHQAMVQKRPRSKLQQQYFDTTMNSHGIGKNMAVP